MTTSIEESANAATTANPLKRMLEIKLEFSGRIIPRFARSFHKASGEFLAPYLIAYPANEADVSLIQEFVQLASMGIVVCSGEHHSYGAHEHADGNIVVNMSSFSQLSMDADGKIVTVGAAASLTSLATFLQKRKLALPLGDNRSLSMIAKAMDGGIRGVGDGGGSFARSYGLLSNYVRSFTLVLSGGAVQRIEKPSSSSSASNNRTYAAVLSGTNASLGIVTELQCECIADIAHPHCTGVYVYFVYRAKTMANLLKAIAEVVRNNQMPADMDMAVRVSSSSFGATVIEFTGVYGNALDASKAYDPQFFEKVIAAGDARHSRKEVKSVSSVMQHSLASGLKGRLTFPFPSTRIVRQIDHIWDASFIDIYCKTLDSAFGAFAQKRVRVTSIIRLSGETACVASVANMSSYIFVKDGGFQLEQEFIQRFSSFKDFVVPELKPKDEVKEDGVEKAMQTQQQKPFLADNEKLMKDVRRESWAGFKRRTEWIPGFKGDVFKEEDGRKYNRAKKQYATSSYPEEATSPFLVAIPDASDNSDIRTALKYAAQEGKYVVIRSGGHHYTALSSGGKDTIVLSMDKFSTIDVVDNILTVGVCGRLSNFSRDLAKANLSLPHGECPWVNIGGHVQTGGYGHFLRSFGLVLDHCISFNIILADGTLRTVKKPLVSKGDEQKTDNDAITLKNADLYWAVMGGNSGSFGVLTSLQFRCIRDIDHPKSTGAKHVFAEYERAVFQSIMESMADWTRKQSEGTLPPDLDLMVTVFSNPLLSSGASIFLEMVYANGEGLEQDYDPWPLFNSIINPALDAAAENNRPGNEFDPVHETLSSMATSFVRPLQIFGGREFIHPYVKSFHCTREPLSQKFVDSFVEEVTLIVEDADSPLRMVVQMLTGGGAYASKSAGNITSIPHRDILHGIVYDVFYRNGDVGLEAAEAAQARAEQKWFSVEDGLYSKEKIYMAWATFGNVNINEVWEFYYDNEEQYNRLREIKTLVDPGDLFHTLFSLPLI